MDIAERIGEGRIVYKPMDIEEYIQDGEGVAMDLAAVQAPMRAAVHFYWPSEDFPGEGVVWGDLTDGKRERVERRALKFLQKAGKGSRRLLWRTLPEWETEKFFEHNKTRHTLRMRGSFLRDDA